MTSRFDFISGLSGEKKGKEFQVYEAQLGIERATVFVPLERVEDFDALLEGERPRSLAKLRSLVKKVDGVVE
jgi:hypothetical protein